MFLWPRGFFCLFVCFAGFCIIKPRKFYMLILEGRPNPHAHQTFQQCWLPCFSYFFSSISRAPSLKQRKKRQGLSTVMFILTAGYISCQIPLSPSCHTRRSLLLFHSAVTSQLLYTLFSHVRLSASLVHLQRWSELHLEITIVKGWARIWLPKQSSTAMWDAIG